MILGSALGILRDRAELKWEVRQFRRDMLSLPCALFSWGRCQQTTGEGALRVRRGEKSEMGMNVQKPTPCEWSWNCQSRCKKKKEKRKESPTSNILIRDHCSLGSTHKVLANFGHSPLLVVPGLPAISSFWQFPSHETGTAEQGLHTDLGTNRKRMPELGNSRTVRTCFRKKSYVKQDFRKPIPI